MTGVVRICTRCNSGPSVGIVELRSGLGTEDVLSSGEEVAVEEAVADSVSVGSEGNGHSCRLRSWCAWDLSGESLRVPATMSMSYSGSLPIVFFSPIRQPLPLRHWIDSPFLLDVNRTICLSSPVTVDDRVFTCAPHT